MMANHGLGMAVDTGKTMTHTKYLAQGNVE